MFRIAYRDLAANSFAIHAEFINFFVSEPAVSLATTTSPIGSDHSPAAALLEHGQNRAAIPVAQTRPDFPRPMLRAQHSKRKSHGGAQTGSTALLIDEVISATNFMIRDEQIAVEGIDTISPYKGHPGRLAAPRLQEVVAAINRNRDLKLMG